MTEFQTISAKALKSCLHDGSELALLDVREHGEYGEAHLFYAVHVPYSKLERETKRLVPNIQTRIVLVDEQDDGLSRRAASSLAEMGYANVSVLQGGQSAWQDSGYQVFAGVNVPSKAFGELAEHYYATPHISALELAALQGSDKAPIVLDGRPYVEYQKMNIPGAQCCPNGELALRIEAIVPDEDTPVVINCAGRTRSIIGAQTLINFGINNPVYALENGTQGWYLADLKLEHGSSHAWPPTQVEDIEHQRQKATKLAARYGVKTISADVLRQMVADNSRTTYLCDVRNPEEYQHEHLPGAISSPGGQLIQATDQYVAVRGARLVLWDGDGVRAPVVAHWLYQLGWEVYILDYRVSPQSTSDMTKPNAERAYSRTQAFLTSNQLTAKLASAPVLIDLRSSADYRKAHIKSSHWLSRRQISEFMALRDRDSHVILVGDNEEDLANSAKELDSSTSVDLFLFDSNVLEEALIESTPDVPTDSERIDYLFFVHDRHDGNKAAARQYLAWELNLVEQLDDQEKAGYRFTPVP